MELGSEGRAGQGSEDGSIAERNNGDIVPMSIFGLRATARLSSEQGWSSEGSRACERQHA